MRHECDNAAIARALTVHRDSFVGERPRRDPNVRDTLRGSLARLTRWTAAGLCAGVLSFEVAAASLVASDDGETVYDAANDVTWLANANLAASKSFGVAGINPDGSMAWTTAQEWIAAMNSAHYLGSDQWSLPTTKLPDDTCSQMPKAAAFGYGCVGGQMGYLYYRELDGVKGSTIELQHGDSYRLFKNIQPYLYWSSTLWTRVPNSAFSFSFGNGFQGTNVFVNAMYAMAVAPGKVGFRSSRQ